MAIIDRTGLSFPHEALEASVEAARQQTTINNEPATITMSAVVLTAPVPLSNADLRAFFGGTAESDSDAAAATNNMVNRFMFKARMLRKGSFNPHVYLQDPCDASQSTGVPFAKLMSLISLHTSCLSQNSYNGKLPKIGDIVEIELRKETNGPSFWYNIQSATFKDIIDSSARSVQQAETAGACGSLSSVFQSQDPSQLASMGVGGARSVASYEEQYSYACRAASPYDAQIRTSARRIGIDPAVLCAIKAVESGNLPPDALRFEPHVFLRNRRDLAGQIPYTRADSPGGCPESRNGACVSFVSYVPTETNKAAFEHAFSLDPGVAVKATSFGLFQVIGFNLPSSTVSAIANYETEPQAFMDYMNADPVRFSFEVVEAWFRANPRALQAAKTHDWLTLALAYNGDKAAEQDYQLKLEAAYNVSARDCYGTAVAAAD